ncbi:MAG TPA: hypothetical protein VJL81_05345 [Solirubrobacterales bacterium]|nr:hypothetical protein [Solirubrobacterales bacterium]
MTAVAPPSTATLAPVMWLERGEARKAIVSAISAALDAMIDHVAELLASRATAGE